MLTKLEAIPYKWKLFWLGLLSSFVPCFVRLLAWTKFEIAFFDVRDFLFAGLALMVLNLTLVLGEEKIRQRSFVILMSVAMLLALSIFSALSLDDSKHNPSDLKPFILHALSILFVFASIYFNYVTNELITDK